MCISYGGLVSYTGYVYARFWEILFDLEDSSNVSLNDLQNIENSWLFSKIMPYVKFFQEL